MTPYPTVFVVDDDAAMRASLRWLLESVGLRVETFASGRDFLERYENGQAGCLVLDLRMPDLSGLELQSELNRRAISLPVIIISGYGEVRTAVDALKAGAVDFLEKPFSEQVLLDRVWQAIKSDHAARRERAERAAFGENLRKLTPRERQVMDLVVAGKSNREIAEQLTLSPKTVEVHRAQVMKKTQAATLADLIRVAVQSGVCESQPARGPRT